RTRKADWHLSMLRIKRQVRRAWSLQKDGSQGFIFRKETESTQPLKQKRGWIWESMNFTRITRISGTRILHWRTGRSIFSPPSISTEVITPPTLETTPCSALRPKHRSTRSRTSIYAGRRKEDLQWARSCKSSS